MNSLIQIENKSGKIKLNEAITEDSIKRAIDEIGRLFGASAVANGADFGEIMNCAENAVDVLDIEINSPGGSVFDGYTIYQEIKSLRDRGVIVNAIITGMAASMASVICMACNKVSMVPHGRMMIHDASSNAYGNSEELRKTADLLDGVSADIANIYAEKTGESPEKMRGMMKKETWMNAKDALDQKFIDEIIDIRNLESKPKGMSLLSKLFPGNDEVSKLEASIAQIDNLTNQIENLSNEVSALKLDIVAKDQTIAENAATIVNLNETVANLQAEAKVSADTIAAKDSEIANLTAEIDKAKNSAADQATAMLAQVGQPEPLAIVQTETNEAPKMTLAAFNQLPPLKRNEFIRNGGKLTN